MSAVASVTACGMAPLAQRRAAAAGHVRLASVPRLAPAQPNLTSAPRRAGIASRRCTFASASAHHAPVMAAALDNVDELKEKLISKVGVGPTSLISEHPESWHLFSYLRTPSHLYCPPPLRRTTQFLRIRVIIMHMNSPFAAFLTASQSH
jgi:hypothetical protein